MFKKIEKIIVNILIFFVKVYQLTLSFDHGLFKFAKPYGACRFYPTCSEYMVQSLKVYGLRGIKLGLKRVARCHPLAEGGYDPVRK